MNIINKLRGGDLRSIGNTNAIVKQIKDQNAFDELFQGLFEDDRIVAMRSADAIEKISLKYSGFLQPHKQALLKLIQSSENKELQWHLSLLISRLELSKKDMEKAVEILKLWALDRSQSRIVRVNSLQALHDLSEKSPKIKGELQSIIKEIKVENIPSLNARLRKLGL